MAEKNQDEAKSRNRSGKKKLYCVSDTPQGTRSPIESRTEASTEGLGPDWSCSGSSLDPHTSKPTNPFMFLSGTMAAL